MSDRLCVCVFSPQYTHESLHPHTPVIVKFARNFEGFYFASNVPQLIYSIPSDSEEICRFVGPHSSFFVTVTVRLNDKLVQCVMGPRPVDYKAVCLCKVLLRN